METIAATADGVWARALEYGAIEVGSVTVRQIVIASAVLALSVMLRALIANVLLAVLRGLTSRSRTVIDDKLVNALAGPAKLVPIIIGLQIAIQVMGVSGGALDASERLTRSLIAIAVFWAAYAAVDPLRVILAPVTRSLTRAMVDWMMKSLKVLAALLGGAAVLEIWGIPVGPILTGLGIFGVAVALGAQDLFKNLIAGLSILLEKRFEKGDWIRVDGLVEGTVENINFRSTTVRRFDKSPVYVPNGKLSDSAVTNFSRMTHRRIYWKVGLEYGATVQQLRYVRDKVFNYLSENPAFAAPPDVSTFVFIDSFNDSSIDMMIYCFTKTTDWGEWLAIKHEFVLALKRMVAEAGTDFAFPSQTAYLVDVANSGEPVEPDLVRAHVSEPLATPPGARGEG